MKEGPMHVYCLIRKDRISLDFILLFCLEARLNLVLTKHQQSSWGPMACLVVGETFPLRTRAKQASLATAANWGGNCKLQILLTYSLSPPGRRKEKKRKNSLNRKTTTAPALIVFHTALANAGISGRLSWVRCAGGLVCVLSARSCIISTETPGKCPSSHSIWVDIWTLARRKAQVSRVGNSSFGNDIGSQFEVSGSAAYG